MRIYWHKCLHILYTLWSTNIAVEINLCQCCAPLVLSWFKNFIDHRHLRQPHTLVGSRLGLIVGPLPAPCSEVLPARFHQRCCHHHWPQPVEVYAGDSLEQASCHGGFTKNRETTGHPWTSLDILGGGWDFSDLRWSTGFTHRDFFMGFKHLRCWLRESNIAFQQ